MTKKKATKTIDPPAAELAPIETTLEGVKDLIVPEALDKVLASPQAQQLFTALSSFAELDYEAEQQSGTAGEVLAKILALPLETQKKLVWALADARKVERPSYEHSGAGRPTTGRNELAAVLYAGHPDMLVKDKGKDTRAAKRLTDHVRRYLIKTGQRQQRQITPGNGEQPTEGTKTPLRALKVVFIGLWEACQSESERRTIVSLYLRMGVAADQMDKWTNRGLLSLAAAPLTAIETRLERSQNERTA